MKTAILFPKDSIAFFSPDRGHSFGGATVQLDTLSRELADQNHELITLIPDFNNIPENKRPPYPGVEVFSNSSSLPVKCVQLAALLVREKPSLVMQRGISPLTLPFCLLLKVLGIKSVFMFAHDVETEGIYQNNRKRYSLFSYLLTSADVLVVQNRGQKENLPRKHHGKTVIFKKGIALDTGEAKKKEYDACWTGRCEKWKNPELFITLADNNQDKRFVMICSKGSDSSYYNTIIKTASSRENVDLFEGIPHAEARKLLKQSAIFVLTSESEGDWPMTVLEAASSGIPVISLSINIEGSLEHYGFGRFCNSHMDELHSALTELSPDSKQYKECSRHGREFIDEVHNIEANTAHLMEELVNITRSG